MTWRGREVDALEGEPISSALAALGEHVLGHHSRDGAPQGLFCAIGQCAQCMVLLDGCPVKACVTRVRDGARVEPMDGVPTLPPAGHAPTGHPVDHVSARVLVIGGGPAGLAAATELGRLAVDVLLVDDKPHLGGKLVLQTHRFFGSYNAVHAGTRGIDIASRLEAELRAQASVRVWTDATALAVFSDGVIGVLRGGDAAATYVLVRPELLLVATGARERSLVFPGNTLPGVMGAGAFQTLLNRDRVRPANRVLVIGGGNVGLIVAYQALQGGVAVAAVVEARPECGGYDVHREKLVRQGIPILTSHTITCAHGAIGVEGATLAQVDERFRVVPGTERDIACDGVLLALGLDPERELFDKAKELGMLGLSAGDAADVAEASAAIFSGRIKALEAARMLGVIDTDVPEAWRRSLEVHKTHGGPLAQRPPAPEQGVVPVFHCVQEIPCDPCAETCPQGGIVIDPEDIRHLPVFVAEGLERPCVACEKCVTICPGQAITLVDYRADLEHPTVVVPFEMPRRGLDLGEKVTAVDVDGQVLGEVEVLRIRDAKASDHTLSVKIRVPRALAQRVAGVRVDVWHDEPTPAHYDERLEGDAIVCRCERVSADALRVLVRAGVHDINALKVETRVGMGACGARTCGPLVRRILREEGVAEEEIVEPRHRPLLVEVPLGALAAAGAGPEDSHE
jgi:NADPH-dependent 2,4-dienoyl-CoA reductase/sulfur reductase-like enzyme/Fe-S-cluster-containing hydrogenase component 2/bacterioferritin-associated ferredoxin